MQGEGGSKGEFVHGEQLEDEGGAGEGGQEEKSGGVGEMAHRD